MTEPIQITTGIPVPPGRSRNHCGMGRMRTALSTMQVGDSFLWESDNRHPYGAAKSVGVKITTRKENGGGWRVWRIA